METIYTMEDWNRDKIFSAAVGQEVEEAIYWEFLGSVPPAYNGHGLFQAGEPYDLDKDTHQDLFTTFQRNERGAWVYMGHCTLGKTEDRTKNGYGYRISHGI